MTDPKKSPNSAVIMFSYREKPEEYRHFLRLQEELSALLPAYFVCHVDSEADLPDSPQQKTYINNTTIKKMLPHRFSARMQAEKRIDHGYFDLVMMTAACLPELNEFDYIYVVAYDADFSGHWADLFKLLLPLDADLLAGKFRAYRQEPEWHHWPRIKCPQRATGENDLRMKCFFPVSRLSRTLIEIYCKEIESGEWSGHFEALIPTIACCNDLLLFDLYDVEPEIISYETFGYRPVRGNSYFYESPEKFARPNFLYHPIKVDWN